MMNPLTEVLASYFSDCSPYRFEGQWAALQTDYYRGPVYGTHCVARLSEQFTEARLLECGIARRAGGGLVLQPQLSFSDQPIVPMFDRASGVCQALMTSNGLVGPSFSAFGLTAHKPAAEPPTNRLFLTDSYSNWALLSALGLNVAVISDWIKAICSDISSTGEGEAGTKGLADPEEIILVAWDPVQLAFECSAGVRALATDLIESKFHGRALPFRVAAWRVSPITLESIRYSLRSGNPSTAAQLVRKSAGKDLLVLGALQDPEVQAVERIPDYALAHERLVAELNASPLDRDPVRLAQAQRDVDAAIDREMVAPMQLRASTMDGADRVFAELFTQLGAAVLRGAPYLGRQNLAGGPPVSVDTVIKLSREIASISKRIEL